MNASSPVCQFLIFNSVNYRFSCMNLLTASYAASSSAPSIVNVTSWPFLTPSPISARSFLQSTFLPSFSMEIVDSKPYTIFTSSPAGRAWIPSLSVTTYLNSFILISSMFFILIFSLLLFISLLMLLC